MSKSQTYQWTKDALRKTADDDPDRLYEMARQVRAMTDTEGWQVLTGLLDDVEGKLMVQITSGRLLRHEQYVDGTAKIAGLRTTREITQAVLDAHNEWTAQQEALQEIEEATNG